MADLLGSNRILAQGLDLKPTFSNRFVILAGVKFVRVAFGEYALGDPDSDSRFHSAFVMPTEDAEALAHAILQFIQQARLTAASQEDGNASKE